MSLGDGVTLRPGAERDPSEQVALDADGRAAWSIVTEAPDIFPLPPVGVPGGAVLVTAAGDVVRLDYR